MSIQSRGVRDRRAVSRVRANLECRFTFEELVQDAHITNISLNGALILSPCLPPEESHIVLTITSPLLKTPLTIGSNVVRTECVSADGIGAFAVVFSHSSLDLIELIKNLISQPFRN